MWSLKTFLARSKIAGLVYRRMCRDTKEGLMIEDPITSLQFEAIADTLFALTEYRQTIGHSSRLFELLELSQLIAGNKQLLPAQLSNGRPSRQLSRAKNTLLGHAYNIPSLRGSCLKAIDSIDKYVEKVDSDSSKVGDNSHNVYGRIVVELLRYLSSKNKGEMPLKIGKDGILKSGTYPDIKVDRTKLFRQIIEDSYNQRKGGTPDRFYEVLINALVKEISIDFTMAREEYLFEKLDKAYHSKDRHLLIVLYGDRASDLDYIRALNEQKDRTLKGSFPNNVQIVSIHEFLDFLGLDSSYHQDSGLKSLVNDLRGLANEVDELLTARFNAFNKREKFSKLQQLGDESWVYLEEVQKDPHYIGQL